MASPRPTRWNASRSILTRPLSRARCSASSCAQSASCGSVRAASTDARHAERRDLQPTTNTPASWKRRSVSDTAAAASANAGADRARDTAAASRFAKSKPSQKGNPESVCVRDARRATKALGPSGETPRIRGRSRPTYPSSAVPPPRLRVARAAATAAVAATGSEGKETVGVVFSFSFSFSISFSFASSSSPSTSIASSSSSPSLPTPKCCVGASSSSSSASGGSSSASASDASASSPEARSHAASAGKEDAGYQHHLVSEESEGEDSSLRFPAPPPDDFPEGSAEARASMDVSSNLTGFARRRDDERPNAGSAAGSDALAGVASASGAAVDAGAGGGSESSPASNPGLSTNAAPMPAAPPSLQYRAPVASTPRSSASALLSRESFALLARAPNAGASAASDARHESSARRCLGGVSQSSFVRSERAAPNAASLTSATGRDSISLRARSGQPTGSAPPPPSAVDRVGAPTSSTSAFSTTRRNAQCTSRSRHSLASSGSPGCAASHSAPTASENAVGMPTEAAAKSGLFISEGVRKGVARGVAADAGVRVPPAPPVPPRSEKGFKSGHSAAASLANGNGGSRRTSAYREHTSHTASASPTIPGSTPKSWRAGGGGPPRVFWNRLARADAAASSARASALTRVFTGRASAEFLGAVAGGAAANIEPLCSAASHLCSRSARRRLSRSAASPFSSRMTANAFMCLLSLPVLVAIVPARTEASS